MSGTEHRVAVTKDDLAKCHQALWQWGFPHADRSIGFPTLMVFRQGLLIAFMATAPVDEAKAVVCDRLALDPGLPASTRAFIAFNLITNYEVLLKNLGMKWYHICVDTDNTSMVESVSKALGITPYSTKQDITWFKRDLV